MRICYRHELIVLISASRGSHAGGVILGWNWRDPRTAALFDEVVRFWFDRGVDGLRIDVAHGLFKAEGLPNLDTPATVQQRMWLRGNPLACDRQEVALATSGIRGGSATSLTVGRIGDAPGSSGGTSSRRSTRRTASRLSASTRSGPIPALASSRRSSSRVKLPNTWGERQSPSPRR
jgi:alpha amylase-like protein